MARRARALIGAGARVLVACCAVFGAAAAQEAKETPPALTLADLSRLQEHPREALAQRSAKELADYLPQVFYQAGFPHPELPDVRWPALLDDLRALARERGLAFEMQAYLDRSQAYFVSEVLHEPARAVQILERGLRELPPHTPWRIELARYAASFERNAEHWIEARALLEQAEAALSDAGPMSDADLLVNDDWASLWIDYALPELARPRVEAELARAEVLGTSEARAIARVAQLNLLNAEEDYDALDRAGDALLREPWWHEVSIDRQILARVLVATGWLTREHNEVVPRGEAERRFDELLETSRSSPSLYPWVLRHAASCAADGGNWPRTRALCAELARALGVEGASADKLPEGRLGGALIALEARTELAASAGAEDRIERLRPHLERVRRAWSASLERWAKAPLRAGGISYLQIAERHQLSQELVELELAVEGEAEGTRHALEDQLAAEQLSTLARRLGTQAVTIADVQRELCPEHAGVLLYVPSRDRSFAFAIDARGVELFHLPPVHRFYPPCRALTLAVQEAVHSGRGLDDPELRAAAAAVARLFVPAEIARRIEGWSTLRLIGIDDVSYVPFELLPAPGGGTRGARQAISYCASLPLAIALQRASTAPCAGGARLLVAPDSAQPGMQLDLDAAQRESLRENLPVPAVVCEGPRADTRALASAPGAEIALLQVLAHGRYDPLRERPAGLQLASTVAWAEDIEALHAPPLVLLAACGAGRAPLRRGDGSRSDLSAAFLVAGARCVVLPTADLELDGTLRAAPIALEHLGAGESAAEALRATRAELAGSDPVAALQAHLLHVVGAGGTRLAAHDRSAGAERGRAPGLFVALLAFLAVALGLALRRRRRNGASGAVD